MYVLVEVDSIISLPPGSVLDILLVLSELNGEIVVEKLELCVVTVNKTKSKVETSILSCVVALENETVIKRIWLSVLTYL